MLEFNQETDLKHSGKKVLDCKLEITSCATGVGCDLL